MNNNIVNQNGQYPQASQGQPQYGAVPQTMDINALVLSDEMQALIASDATGDAFGGASFPTVSIKGRCFRLIQDGTEILMNPNPMEFIVVAAGASVERTFYEGTYVDGTHERPVCSSRNGTTPSASSQIPQAVACAVCPQNKEGSGLNGSRACRYSQAIAVTLPNDFSRVFGMRIPASSLFGSNPAANIMGLQAYARMLKTRRIPISMVSTLFGWDYSAAVPVLSFSAARALTAAEYQQILQMQSSEAVQNIVNPMELNVAPLQLMQPQVQQPQVAYQPQVQQPVYQQPVVQQPVYQQPVVQQPVYQQPVVQQPQPMYQQPVEVAQYQAQVGVHSHPEPIVNAEPQAPASARKPRVARQVEQPVAAQPSVVQGQSPTSGPVDVMALIQQFGSDTPQ